MSQQLPGYSPAGTAVYSGNTFHVGDGTWDRNRDTFLLPNIEALPFDVMRYNGMGNRFAGLPQYHSLIRGHAIVAVITFIFIVPAAILIASFYHRDPRLALRTHITLQVITVLLTTIVFVLGYFAVGPERSLTNPHHGIGVAIYVLVLIQFIGGWLIHKIEKGKMRHHIPIKLMLHQWVGRAIALLAFAQIPIGLTLYGSPAFTFVLYAIAMFALLVLYFVLTYNNYKRMAGGYDDRGSYVSGAQTESDHHHSRLKMLTGGLVGGAGLYALRRRLSGKKERSESRSAITGSSVTGSESYAEEKFTEDGSAPPRERDAEDHTWRNRILGGVAGLGALEGMRRFADRFDMDKRREKRRSTYVDSDVSQRPPLGGAVAPGGGPSYPTMGGPSYPPMGGPSYATGRDPNSRSAEHMDRLEAGLPSSANDPHWREVEDREAGQLQERVGGVPDGERGVGGTHDSQLSMSQSQYSERDNRVLGPFGIPMTSFGGIRGWFQRRRSKKEQRRIDDERQREYEKERLFGPQTGQTTTFTGDGSPRREAGRVGFVDQPNGSQTITRDFGSQPPPQNIPPPPQSTHMPPPPPAHREFSASNSPTIGGPRNLPPPPRARRYSESSNVIANGDPRVETSAAAVEAGEVLADTSTAAPGNTYTSYTQQQQQQNINAPATGPSPANRSRDASTARGSGGVDSPPVSVSVKMHNDGRHVTLRRLNDSEAEARRQRRNSFEAGDDSEMSPDYSRFRRVVAGQSPSGSGPPRAGPPPAQTQTIPNVPSPQMPSWRQQGLSSSPGGPSQTQTAGGVQQQQTSTPQPPRSSHDPSELHLPSPPYAQQSGVSPPSALGQKTGGTGLGSSPGGGYMSDTSNKPDENRRRRRAERARAQQAREESRAAAAGGKVEFE